MSVSIEANPPADTADSLRVRIPFVSTSFATDVLVFTILWPVWWILGVEQLLLPFFFAFETVKLLLQTRGRLRIETTGILALLLAIWWLVPLFWMDRDHLDIFLKESATIAAQFMAIVLFWNWVRSREDWNRIVSALIVFAVYIAFAGLIYLSGIWRGELTSVIGRLLPPAMVNSSAFFSSIAIRSFGTRVVAGSGVLPLRLSSFSLAFSALSMLTLVLIPIVHWRLKLRKGRIKLLYAGLILALVVCLVWTESRMTYLAFVAGVCFYVVLRLNLLGSTYRPLTIALILGGMALALLLSFILLGPIASAFQSFFFDLRPTSWLVRSNIYRQTLELLPQHPIAGWGVAVRIPGVSSTYSAGTHSSYLGMLFQHGIVGLALYLGIWLTLWRRTIRGLTTRWDSREAITFWVAIAVSFFMFNIREVADTWWWDQSITFVIWLVWGLALTADRLFKQESAETGALPPPAGDAIKYAGEEPD